MGLAVTHLPGLTMSRLVDPHPGRDRTDARDAFVIVSFIVIVIVDADADADAACRARCTQSVVTTTPRWSWRRWPLRRLRRYLAATTRHADGPPSCPYKVRAKVPTQVPTGCRTVKSGRSRGRWYKLKRQAPAVLKGESVMTTILIAEDTDDIREVLQRLFTRAGFTVQTAPDGRAALELARQDPPDIVLTDLDMPHLDGVQLCQAIRQDPILSDTPVAILSGALQPDDPRIADAHVCGVLLKPFTNQDLVSAVRRLADSGRHQTHSPCSATV